MDPLEPRRKIPWEALDAGAIDARVRAKVGGAWRARMKQEHLAVGAFALLTSELAAEGCEPVVLSRVAWAASDEVRHADVCRRLAALLLGDSAVPHRLRGVPRVPSHPEASAGERAILHVVEMCCLSETLTCVYLTEMLARATHPAARAALESLLEDEIDHGRVGWAHLATRRDPALAPGLPGALPAMLERTVGWVMKLAETHPEPDDRSLEALGYLGHDAGAAIFARALRDVILPGFEVLGVDLGPARQYIAERRWLAR